MHPIIDSKGTYDDHPFLEMIGFIVFFLRK